MRKLGETSGPCESRCFPHAVHPEAVTGRAYRCFPNPNSFLHFFLAIRLNVVKYIALIGVLVFYWIARLVKTIQGGLAAPSRGLWSVWSPLRAQKPGFSDKVLLKASDHGAP